MKSLQQLLKLLDAPSARTPALETERVRYGYAVLRVSGKSQNEQAQRADIERACQQNNLVVTRWHQERERANDVEARQEFLKFIEDAKRDSQCEFVICRDPSRLFRNALMIEKTEQELAAHGVRLIDDYRFVNFTEDLTPASVGMKGMLRLQNEMYSAQCRDWTLKSMAHICQQRDPQTGWAYHLGGLPLFGYKRVKVPTGQVDKRGNEVYRELWLLNDDVNPILGKPLWEVVREMWLEWYVQRGWGEERITRYLVECGVKSARGKDLNVSTIVYLRSPFALLTYTGIYIWNKWSFHQLGRRVRKVLNPPHTWVWVKDAHPAIFTLDEAKQIEECVQERSKQFKKRRISHSAEAARSYALSGGMAKCGVCGSNIVGYGYQHYVGKRKGKKEYVYYWCGTHQYRAGQGCGPRFSVRARELEQAILENAKVLFPISLDKAQEWADKVNAIVREKYSDVDARRQALEKHTVKLEGQINNLVDAIAQGGAAVAHRLGQRIMQLEQERDKLAVELNKLPLIYEHQFKDEDIIRAYNRLDEAIESTNAERRRDVIRMYVDSITFHPEERRVEVWYYWGGIFTNNLVAPRGSDSVRKIPLGRTGTNLYFGQRSGLVATAPI